MDLKSRQIPLARGAADSLMVLKGVIYQMVNSIRRGLFILLRQNTLWPATGWQGEPVIARIAKEGWRVGYGRISLDAPLLVVGRFIFSLSRIRAKGL